jgi:hypothetical protein
MVSSDHSTLSGLHENHDERDRHGEAQGSASTLSVSGNVTQTRLLAVSLCGISVNKTLYWTTYKPLVQTRQRYNLFSSELFVKGMH